MQHKKKFSPFVEEYLDKNGILKRKPRKKKIAFGWFGGKYSHLNWLLPLLPKCLHYCEPFGGSAAVLLNREPSPIETYNDIDGEIVNFFEVLRNQRDRLIEVIALTPYSREEFVRALQQSKKRLSKLERARRFYIRARQSRIALAQTAKENSWSYIRTTSRGQMCSTTSRWLGSPVSLIDVSARLAKVQFENKNAIDIIKRYDSPGTLFYCDPPYPHESRQSTDSYKYEMSNRDHEHLAEILHSIKGKAVISGYKCELMDRAYSDWECIEAPIKWSHGAHGMRIEVIWTKL